MHRLEKRHAESLVLAHAEIHVRQPVVRHQLALRGSTSERDSRETEIVDQLAKRHRIDLHVRVDADQEQATVRVDAAAIEVEDLEDVLDPFVRYEPADVEEVHVAVAVGALEPVDRPCRVPVGVEHDREHGARLEAERLELATVELRVREGQRRVHAQRAELLAPARAERRDLGVDAAEELRRGDVVVDEHPRVRQQAIDVRDFRADREVVDDRRIRARMASELANRARLAHELCVDMLGEDLRAEAHTAQHAAQRQRLLRDRVAERQVRHQLMHGSWQARTPTVLSPNHRRSRSSSSRSTSSRFQLKSR